MNSHLLYTREGEWMRFDLPISRLTEDNEMQKKIDEAFAKEVSRFLDGYEVETRIGDQVIHSRAVVRRLVKAAENPPKEQNDA